MDTTILDYPYDETNKFIMTFNNHILQIASTKIVLIGDDWKYDLAKDNIQSINLSNRDIRVSKNNNVFQPPTLTEKQKQDLTNLCNSLKEYIKSPKEFYPFDEKSIYMLYMGALNDHKQSIYLLKNLSNLFDVDGAIAETIREINF